MEWGRILAAALPATGENVSIWPFVLLGVGILLIAALVVLQIASKKKGGPDIVSGARISSPLRNRNRNEKKPRGRNLAFRGAFWYVGLRDGAESGNDP